MRLSDIMASAGLTSWAETALLLFMAAFLLILVSLLRRDRRAYDDAMTRMPLHDGVPIAAPDDEETQDG